MPCRSWGHLCLQGTQAALHRAGQANFAAVANADCLQALLNLTTIRTRMGSILLCIEAISSKCNPHSRRML